MDSLIQTINKLQDVFAVIGEHKIDLPQIVVVGSQSSGKSSVLESLVGRSFLPRGTGIVTRAPLILQMIRYSREDRDEMLKITKNDDIKFWASFLHKPGTIYDNFDEIRYEIEDRTDSLAGANKGITHEPIVLKVFTPLYDLTFVDLPGITKVPVGDQPEDIDEQIQELILKYVQQPNSIILAVVTANTDPSTSESLKIARKMDPEGERTIAVVTKLDLIDKGTIQDTTDLLCGHKIPVKLGIIGVVNRSQKDINDNKSMKETLKSEKDFLRSNYPDIYKKHGNKVLAKTLQGILIKHIKKTYPILHKNLQDTKTRLENELKTLQTPDSKVSFILGLLKEICKSYCDTIMGNRRDVSDKIVMGGARIGQIINEEYLEKINNIDPLHDLTDEQIGIILLNTAGITSSSFVNEKALENMICRQLNNLIGPSMSSVDFVRVEMLKIFDCIDENILETLKRFPRINSDVRNVLHKMLDDKLTNIKEFIKSYIETYQTCLNTTNPNFLFQLVKSSTEMQESFITSYMSNPKGDSIKNKEGAEEDEKDEENLKIQQFKQMLSGLNDLDNTIETSKQVKIHRCLTQCYFDFIREIVRDFVPKRIHHKMVKLILDDFEHHLDEFVFTPYVLNRSFDEVLVEEDSVIEDRNRVEKMLDAVNKALKNMVDIQCY
ncbi:dynamin-1-like protein [Acyrthosiphon pisum]|uniref:Dynamin-type G domain-containing protein n=1 Tax=Acyrthosiphon pisum TaxID=7029 RepID=A0A8R2A6C4_ACYPI|nr:dynamin-1-like protein [Acyrthosiphon pisum]|eukprot:XP_003241122.1 PREDICTED: dynamin-1-like protein [Acyrthosiphon pisum]